MPGTDTEENEGVKRSAAENQQHSTKRPCLSDSTPGSSKRRCDENHSKPEISQRVDGIERTMREVKSEVAAVKSMTLSLTRLLKKYFEMVVVPIIINGAPVVTSNDFSDSSVSSASSDQGASSTLSASSDQGASSTLSASSDQGASSTLSASSDQGASSTLSASSDQGASSTLSASSASSDQGDSGEPSSSVGLAPR